MLRLRRIGLSVRFARSQAVIGPLAVAFLILESFGDVSGAAELIAPLAQIKPDHPRVLVRPKPTPWALSLPQLSEIPEDPPFLQMLGQLRGQKSPSAQAMVWLLTGENGAADRAIATMQAYRFPGDVDTFHVFFTLTQFAFAYDWLHNYPGFTPELKAEIRARLAPLAERGLRFADDHMFHNYIWMSAGGVAMWALATAGDDAQADHLFERIRQRFNSGLFPAWKYLDGLPSEPMGYWALYVFTPGMLAVLGAQSAFEADVVGAIRRNEDDWLTRHFENVIHSTLPDMRYVPWGDLQSGPNGGVTREMAGIMDALTWATHSPYGAFFSGWLAGKRGLQRFQGDSVIYYFLYARHLNTAPSVPPLSFLAGNNQGGHFMARSGWDDGATLVTFRSTDHFGDHHHYDQGSFIIYRNGLLAVDPPVYRKVRGPQQPTEVHNTLLLGGQPQRPVRGQWFKTVEDFRKNLEDGRQLETGDILFWKEAGAWAAVAGQFAQAYSTNQVESCVRQMLFVRPGKIVVVDQLTAPANATLPDVQWLLQLPKAPVIEGRGFWVSNGKSWLRCQPLWPGDSVPTIEPTAVNTHRVSLPYRPKATLKLVHLIEVGDGSEPGLASDAVVRELGGGIEITLNEAAFLFSSQPPFAVSWVNDSNP